MATKTKKVDQKRKHSAKMVEQNAIVKTFENLDKHLLDKRVQVCETAPPSSREEKNSRETCEQGYLSFYKLHEYSTRNLTFKPCMCQGGELRLECFSDYKSIVTFYGAYNFLMYSEQIHALEDLAGKQLTDVTFMYDIKLRVIKFVKPDGSIPFALVRKEGGDSWGYTTVEELTYVSPKDRIYETL